MASEDLFNLRSAKAAAAIAWLNGVANALDETGRSYEGHDILASDIAVETFVYTRRLRPRDHGGGQPVRERNEESDLIDNTLAPLYEQPRDWEVRERQRWSRLMRMHRRRLGVRGAPGSGKSFLTQNTTVRMARQAAQQLDQRDIHMEEACIPFWASASALARAASEDEPARIVVRGAQIALEELNRRVDSAPKEWLIEQAASSRALIIVDGLDQLEREQIDSFRRAAARLNSLPGSLIAACRTLHWEERSKWLSWSGLEEVELAPFGLREQRQFGSMFAGGAITGRLSQVLNGNHTLRHACSSPLLLTFVGELLARGKDLTGANRVTLYSEIIDLLLSGDWRNLTPTWKGNSWLTAKVRDFLENAAWSIFYEVPEANRFTLHQWGKTGTEPVPDLLPELERCGLLVPAGTNNIGDYCWSFLHRTVLEFLAARALSRKPEKEWLAEAKKHFWYQPEWIEVLTFLSAHLPDSSELLALALTDRPDPFCWAVMMQQRLADSARRLPANTTRKIFQTLYTHYRVRTRARWYADFPTQVCGKVLSNGESALAKQVRRLTKHQLVPKDAGPMKRHLLRHFAEGLRASENSAVPPEIFAIVSMLRDCTDAPIDLIIELAGASAESVLIEVLPLLAKYDDQRAWDALIDNLNNPLRSVRLRAAKWIFHSIATFEPTLLPVALARSIKHTLVHDVACRVVSELGDDAVTTCPDVIPILQQWLRFDDGKIRHRAWQALLAIGDRSVIGMADDLLGARYEEPGGWIGHLSAKDIVSGLSRSDDVGAEEKLLEWLSHPDPSVRAASVRELGRRVKPEFMESVLRLKDDSDPAVRGAVAFSLGFFWDNISAQALSALGDDPNSYVSSEAAQAIGVRRMPGAWDQLGRILNRAEEIDAPRVIGGMILLSDPRSFPALRKYVVNPDEAVRVAAVRGVTAIGGIRAFDLLCRVASRDEDKWIVLGACRDEKADADLLRFGNPVRRKRRCELLAGEAA